MTQENLNVAAETTETAAVTLTREEKLLAKYNTLLARIKKDTASATEIADELNSISALASVGVGSSVIVKLGRAETTRTENGVVLAVKEDEDGSKSFKVQYGEGFDTEIVVVGPAKISLPDTAPVAEAVPVE